MDAGGVSRRIPWCSLRFLDEDAAFVLGTGRCRALQGRRELGRHIARDLEEGFVGGNADRANLVAGDVPSAAQQRQQPARIGILAAANIHAIPDDIVKPVAVMLGPVTAVAAAVAAIAARGAIIAVTRGRTGRHVDQLLGVG